MKKRSGEVKSRASHASLYVEPGSTGSSSSRDEDMSAYSDEQLVLEALNDSDLAFGQLVRQYQYRVMRTIASIITDEQGKPLQYVTTGDVRRVLLRAR